MQKAEQELEGKKEEFQHEKRKWIDDMHMLAELAGIHLPNVNRGNDSSSSSSGGSINYNSWSPMKLLRAAFTPVTAAAYASVVGCGHSMVNDIKSAISWCIQQRQRASIDALFTPKSASDAVSESEAEAEACEEKPCDWAIYSKMHDCTKLEVTMPEHMQYKLKGATVTARGSLIVNTMVQEDVLETPHTRQVALLPPVIMDVENAETVYFATHVGQAGHLLTHILQSLRENRLRHAIVIDNADMGSANLKSFRYTRAHIKKVADDLRCFVTFVRCDGHMLHITASIPMTRAGCSSALYSAALLMRSSSNKWRLARALHDVIQQELVWIHDGTEPSQEDRAYSQQVLDHTMLRHVVPESEPQPGSAEDRRVTKLMNFAKEILDTLNGNWRQKRVVHRCTRRPDGRLCCSSRSVAVDRVVRLLSKIFMNHLPPVPALSKWTAAYPMLSYLVLGSLLHDLMARIWLKGILNMPGMISRADYEDYVAPVVADEQDGDGVLGAAPRADGDGDAGRGGADDAQQQQQQQTEDEFRKARSKRAARIMRWMSHDPSQMWSCIALYVAYPIATLVGHYLQDEYMFAPSLVQHDPNAVRPWLPLRTGAADRPVPTLYDFMRNDLLALRTMQSRIARVLDMAVGPMHFIRVAFEHMPPSTIYEALQHQVLETLGDTFLRFSCEYSLPDKELVKLCFPEEEVSAEEKLEIAERIARLPACETKELYEGKLLKFYPTAEELCSEDIVFPSFRRFESNRRIATESAEIFQQHKLFG